jgi:hypothetical protein
MALGTGERAVVLVARSEKGMKNHPFHVLSRQARLLGTLVRTRKQLLTDPNEPKICIVPPVMSPSSLSPPLAGRN